MACLSLVCLPLHVGDVSTRHNPAGRHEPVGTLNAGTADNRRRSPTGWVRLARSGCERRPSASGCQENITSGTMAVRAGGEIPRATRPGQRHFLMSALRHGTGMARAKKAGVSCMVIFGPEVTIHRGLEGLAQ